MPEPEMTNGRIEGIVVSGAGEGAHFMSLEWVRAAVRASIGFEPYPGTLNLRLGDAGALRRWREARDGTALRLAPPATGSCGGRLVPVVVSAHIPAGVIVPDVTRYGDDVLELVAAVHLRSRLGLRDGDVVTISV
jgi:riboflavin kinase